MPKSGISRANQNKAIRQEALREQLAAQGHVQHVIDIANKLTDLEVKLEANDVTRLKAAADIKKGLISKYLPDLKSIELSEAADFSNYSDDELRDLIDAYIASS